MSKTLLERYNEMRTVHRDWEERAQKAYKEIEDFFFNRRLEISAKEALHLLSEMEASEKDIKKIKLRLRSESCQHNKYIMQDYVSLRAKSSLFDFGVYKEALGVAEKVTAFTKDLIREVIKVLNESPSAENEHKALCLARDLVRLRKLMHSSNYRDLPDLSKIDVEESSYMDVDIFNLGEFNTESHEFFDCFYFEKIRESQKTDEIDLYGYSSSIKDTIAFCTKMFIFIDRLTDYNVAVIK